MYTYTFRNMVRYCAKQSDASILASWTDKRFPDVKGCEERIVTYSVARNEELFMDMLGKLMELAGIDAQRQGLRVTDNGYVKCNCTLPGFIKFN